MGLKEINQELIEKYNQPVPRYTSYPTVPHWHDQIDRNEWNSNFKIQFKQNNQNGGISLYIHLPFCESLCTYCGCNKRITTNHKVEGEYLEVLKKEWSLYRAMMQEQPVLRELHLGGGTPTFFSPENLKILIEFITKDAVLHSDYVFSIEGHPNNTTIEHLQTLHQLGFRRISYGVQDLDEKVQKVINRIQPSSVVKAATDNARAIGFTSVNFDLIYGLPLQTLDSIKNTIEDVLTLMPDRIAFYSYAHVPWTSKAQRLFDESDLPSADEKLALYLLGRKLLVENGYVDIGMDHFALPNDEMTIAQKEGRLHRNFMGYTIQDAPMLIGLGVSAISDAGNAFAQNEKTINVYYAQINSGKLAIRKGYFLDDVDIRFGRYIRNIACKGYTKFEKQDQDILESKCFPKLAMAVADGLVKFDSNELQLLENGFLFLRNICSAFDLYLNKQQTEIQQTFSKAI